MYPLQSDLFYYPYTLRPRQALNAKSTAGDRHGALLRSSGGGVACLQPWPELGDASLQDELAALLTGKPLPLGKRALDCLMVDEAARIRGESLFSPDRPVPPSHASLPGEISDTELLAFHEAGFRIGKCKGSRDIGKLAATLSRYRNLLPDWQWRIDFNGVLSEREFPEAADILMTAAWGKIDFFEDPARFKESLWKTWSNANFPLAADRLTADDVLTEPLSLRVWKPAVDTELSFSARRWVVTSYMDHPIGQAWAAYEAARLQFSGASVLTCGLVTHHLYESNVFSEKWGTPRPHFPFPGGTGLGFNELLDSFPWKKLLRIFG